jgi:hypothetical protein
MELGAPLTLVAGRFVHLTFKPYLQVYSDRVCPTPGDAAPTNATRSDGCTLALAEAASGQPDSYGALSRFTSARFLLQAALEIRLTYTLNLYFLFEGAPGTERESYTRRYNVLMGQEKDYALYGRAGVTFKF